MAAKIKSISKKRSKETFSHIKSPLSSHYWLRSTWWKISWRRKLWVLTNVKSKKKDRQTISLKKNLLLLKFRLRNLSCLSLPLISSKKFSHQKSKAAKTITNSSTKIKTETIFWMMAMKVTSHLMDSFEFLAKMWTRFQKNQ